MFEQLLQLPPEVQLVLVVCFVCFVAFCCVVTWFSTTAYWNHEMGKARKELLLRIDHLVAYANLGLNRQGWIHAELHQRGKRLQALFDEQSRLDNNLLEKTETKAKRLKAQEEFPPTSYSFIAIERELVPLRRLIDDFLADKQRVDKDVADGKLGFYELLDAARAAGRGVYDEHIYKGVQSTL